MPSGEAGTSHLVTLLAAVTATGASASADLGDLRDEFSLFVATTGSPTFAVQFQGSVDGTNWFSLGAAVTAVTNGTTVSGTLARYVRANLTALSGGTLTAEVAFSVALGRSSAAVAATTVTAADTSIVVGGTSSAVTVATGTLDVIAAQHAPAANWSNNSKKITSLANGSSAQDAAAFGQIPAALPPNGTAGGVLTGTYPNPGISTLNQNTTGTASNITSTLDQVPTAAANVALGSHKITGLAKGTAATDVVNVSQAAYTASQAARYGAVSGQPPRESLPFYAATAAQTCTAGVLYLTVIPVLPGDVISNVGFVAGSTAATFGTSGQHWWTALYDQTVTLIAQSADQTNTAIAGGSAHMLALGSGAPYTVPGGVTWLYGAVMVNTGTGGSPAQPTVRGPSQNTATVDSASSLFPTALIYGATNGTALGATAPTGPLTIAATSAVMYLGAS